MTMRLPCGGARVVKKLRDRLFLDRATRELIAHNRKTFESFRVPKPEGEILLEIYSIPQLQIAYSYFANVLAQKYNASIRSFAFSAKNLFLYRLAFRRVMKVFASFNSLGHVNIGALRGEPLRRKKVALERALDALKTKEDLLRLEVEGVPIGCDVYEAYLAEYKEPTVKVDDPRVAKILEICIHGLIFWDEYLKKHRVKAILMSHGLYRYGVLVKLALERGVPVYLPSVLGVTQITPGTKPGVPDFRRYPEIFRELSEQERSEGLALAKKQLEKRFSAVVGVDMAYSTKSAFQRRAGSEPVFRKTDRHKVLITTHCFFDNPHAYGGNPFSDFYDWLSFLGELSTQTEYDWYLKTHPDVIPENIPVIDRLLAKYPRITRIPPETSFHQLAEEGLSSALTVYGSVGHELPLLGIQVLNAGFNPHVAYTFNTHAKDLEDYRRLVLNLPALNQKIDPNQVYEFYYTHHYASTVVDDFMLPSYHAMARELGAEKLGTSAVYTYFLRTLDERRERTIFEKLRWFLTSGETRYAEHRFRRRRNEGREFTSSLP
ncbi:MAG: hypothetical protein ACXWP5_04310 [Bdellovibrionota bacterium]